MDNEHEYKYLKLFFWMNFELYVHKVSIKAAN